MTITNVPVAVVTGCSSGIGRATALRLRRAGLNVYASARQPARIADLGAHGIHTLRLDVSDDTSMTAAVDRVHAECGKVDVLINNAGVELIGTVEETPPAQIRAQFEANLFGPARLIQLVLPGMRERGHGRIVNVSSVFGRFAVAGNAYYAATKHSLTALTEALRREVGPFGIGVVLVEPTVARTRLHANALAPSGVADGAYAALHDELARWHTRAYAGPPRNVAGRMAVSADDVADVITKAVTSRRPRAHYPVGVLAYGLFALRRWMPTPVFDAFVRSQFPTPATRRQGRVGA